MWLRVKHDLVTYSLPGAPRLALLGPNVRISESTFIRSAALHFISVLYITLHITLHCIIYNLYSVFCACLHAPCLALLGPNVSLHSHPFGRRIEALVRALDVSARDPKFRLDSLLRGRGDWGWMVGWLALRGCSCERWRCEVRARQLGRDAFLGDGSGGGWGIFVWGEGGARGIGFTLLLFYNIIILYYYTTVPLYCYTTCSFRSSDALARWGALSGSPPRPRPTRSPRISADT